MDRVLLIWAILLTQFWQTFQFWTQEIKATWRRIQPADGTHQELHHKLPSYGEPNTLSELHSHLLHPRQQPQHLDPSITFSFTAGYWQVRRHSPAVAHGAPLRSRPVGLIVTLNIIRFCSLTCSGFNIPKVSKFLRRCSLSFSKASARAA